MINMTPSITACFWFYNYPCLSFNDRPKYVSSMMLAYRISGYHIHWDLASFAGRFMSSWLIFCCYNCFCCNCASTHITLLHMSQHFRVKIIAVCGLVAQKHFVEWDLGTLPEGIDVILTFGSGVDLMMNFWNSWQPIDEISLYLHPHTPVLVFSYIIKLWCLCSDTNPGDHEIYIGL